MSYLFDADPTVALPLGTGAEFKYQTITTDALTGTSVTMAFQIPANSLVLGTSLNVDTAVTDDDGNDTWSSELNDSGQVLAIGAGSAAAKNTKVNKFAATMTDAATDIVLTPNGTNFTAGVITARCWWIEFTQVPDAA